MRFLVTADVHLKMWSDKLFDEFGIPMKLNESLFVFDNMCKYATENGIKNLFVAGDVNDLKNVVHYKSFVLLKKIIEKYNNLMFYILSGNHDEASREDIMSAIQLLDGPSNVKTIVKDPVEIENITIIPWTNNVLESLKEAKENKILISHFGINEAKVNSGMSIRSKIGLKDLKKFDLVLLGHYHYPQNIENVYYVGSSIQLRKSEAGEDKRFLIVDSDTLDVTSVLTEGYRKYYNFDIDDESKKDSILKECKSLSDEGHYITIRNKLETPIEYEGIQIIHEYEKEECVRGITTSMPIEEQFKKYMAIMDIPEKERDNYLKIAISTLGIKNKNG